MDEEQRTEIRRQTAREGDEVVQREEIHRAERVPRSILGQRIVYYVGGAIVVLLTVRFLLLLLGASRASAFVDFIYGITGVFVAPFNGIFEEPSYGRSVFDSATLVAMLVYIILTIGIAKLFTLSRRDRDTV